jgi:GTP diphosphokinase / guanosine-3',5'-bis(diphosphate) 3'-diphosphatase
MLPESQKIDIILKSLSGKDAGYLKQAVELMEKAHKGQKRKSGDPYIIHPYAVASDLWDRYADIQLTIAGLLHDVVEDCPSIKIEMIYKNFGKDIGFMVDAVNKKTLCFYQNKKIFLDSIERFLWAGMHDIRVFLLKLSDRKHNIKTLSYLLPHKQVRIMFETQAVYEPLDQILDSDNCMNIKKIKKRFDRYLDIDNIQDHITLKESLLHMYYENFSSHTFQEVYKNSDKVAWQIDSIDEFTKLCQKKDCSKSIDILRMYSDGIKKYVVFRFCLSSPFFKNTSSKLKIKSFVF